MTTTTNTEDRVSVNDGKYTIILGQGKLTALRHGEPWQDLTGNNLVYWLAVELQAARAALAQQPAASGEPVEMSPEFIDTPRAALLWVLWHHQDSSSPVGHPLRFALGLDAHAPLEPHQIKEAKRWAALTNSTTAEFHAAPQPAPALVPLTEEQVVMDAIMMMPASTASDCAKACEYGIRYAERHHRIGAPAKDDAV